MLDKLTTCALLGTQRGRGALPVLPEPMQSALATLPEREDAAARLLDAASIAAWATRSGVMPTPISLALDVAPEDKWPVCSDQAAQVLQELLTQVASPFWRSLSVQWFMHASERGVRVPHKLLPAVLDMAAQYSMERDPIFSPVDARGRWLLAKHPRWAGQKLVDLERAEEDWQTSSAARRVAILRAMRKSDPAKAVAMIRATWASDHADEKARFIDVLQPPFTSDELTFLEEASSDRAKSVREAALTLLRFEPRSAVSRRMLDRANKLLKLATITPIPRIDVTLPPATLEPIDRIDGIVEKPPTGMGVRQYGLQQVISFVPPAHWTEHFALTPEQCIRALSGEFAGNVITGWTAAAARFGDRNWSYALFVTSIREHRTPPPLSLLPLVEPELALELLVEIAQNSAIAIGVLSAAMQCVQPGMSNNLASALLDRLSVEVSRGSHVHQLAPLIQHLSLGAPLSLREDLESFFAAPVWLAVRKPIADMFAVLSMRQKIRAAFA